MSDDTLQGAPDIGAVMDNIVTVELPEDLALQGSETPHPDNDADPQDDPHPDADPYAGMEPDNTPDGASAESADPDRLFDPDNLRLSATFPINDLGNSRRFVLHFGENVMFVPRVGFHVWDERVWAVDPDLIATRRKAQLLSQLVEAEIPFLTLLPEQMRKIGEEAQLLADRAAAEARKDEDGKITADAALAIKAIDLHLEQIARLKDSLAKKRTAHRTFARSTGNTAKIKAALTEAEVPLATGLDDLDTRPLDVNTESGILRFSTTPRPGTYPEVRFEHLPHDRDLRMTKILTTGHDPQAAAPIFTAFLDRVQPDPAMQAFLQRWFGYSMLGLTSEQALVFFYGMGANGKSALIDLMARLMGSYAATAKIESLTGQNRRSAADATPDLVNIVAARMVRASEPEKGVEWQEGLIKQLTGGEPILVRALNENFVEVTPIFKLVISGNHAPDIRGMDDGIWRRLMIVPFDVSIPKEERDARIVEKMLAEGPGILNWLIEGAMNYLEGGLAPPTAVSSATDTLRADSDPYGKFLDDACVVTGDDRDSITSRELMLCFQFWQMRRGETPFRERRITTSIKDHSRRWRSPATGHKFTARETGRFNGYDGLRLSDLFQRDWDNAPKDSSGKAISVGRDSEQRRFSDED